MEFIDFLRLIKRKKGTIFSIVFVFVVFTAIFSFVQPLRYRIESRALFVQTDSVSDDSYARARTNEYLGSIMSRVIPSNTFFNEVINSGYKIDEDYFEGDTRKKMKKWRQTVMARSMNESGIIEISVFHTSKYQGEQIARAVNYILKNKHSLYHGLSDSVVIKIIDQPISSKFPVKPNIPLNFSLAFILSVIVSFIYVYSFPGSVYNIRLLPRRKNKRSGSNLENIKFSSSNSSNNIENKKNNNLDENLSQDGRDSNLNNTNHANEGNIRNII